MSNKILNQDDRAMIDAYLKIPEVGYKDLTVTRDQFMFGEGWAAARAYYEKKNAIPEGSVVMTHGKTEYDLAQELVIQYGQCSPAFLQRKMKIGYTRALSLVQELEDKGIVGPLNGSIHRDVLIRQPS